MKKILAILLSTSSIAVFADTFQDFNNNLYAQYNYSNYHQNGTENNNIYSNGYGIGGTFQSKDNVWLNAVASSNSPRYDGEALPKFATTNIRAGYAFQFFGDDDNGFQIIPYASFSVMSFNSPLYEGANNSPSYTWGAGVQPEYRFLSSFKASLGLGLYGYSGDSTFAALNGGDNCGCNTIFAFNVNPEVQYDIAKTVMLAVGYNFATPFNAQNSVSTNTVTAKVGYLF